MKPVAIKDEPRETGQYLGLPSGTDGPDTPTRDRALPAHKFSPSPHVCLSKKRRSAHSTLSSPSEDALQLPPTPPSSNHGDSDGSLPPSSPHLPLPPSSPQPQQRPGGRASSASSSSAISSSPLLTAPHVSTIFSGCSVTAQLQPYGLSETPLQREACSVR